MAKKNMTLEEKLEEAIVKDVPYEVPGNWVWVNLKSVTEINMGQSPKSEDVGDNLEGYPLIGGPSDMGDINPLKNRYTTKASKISSIGTIIMSIRATLGKLNVSDGEYCLGRGVAEIKPLNISREFLIYYLSFIKDELYKCANGTTFLQISKPDIENLKVIIPPLKEQQRIVDRIESLFEKIDKAKELIEEAREGFEKRKVIILQEAILGNLTIKWRNDNKLESAYKELEVIKKSNDRKFSKADNTFYEFDIPDTWIWTNLGEVTQLLSDYHSNGSYEILKEHVELLDEPNYSYMIRTTNFEKNNFTSLMKYISKEAYEFLGKTKLYGEEILINKIGNAGSVYYMPKLNNPASLAMNLFMIRIVPEVSSKYIYYHLLTIYSKNDIEKFIKGVTTKSIDKKAVNSLKIALPPLKEQIEIVKNLDKLLEEGSKIEELTQLEEQIELIKKSILAKAFRGELGTNCEDDESALELLKEILKKNKI